VISNPKIHTQAR